MNGHSEIMFTFIDFLYCKDCFKNTRHYASGQSTSFRIVFCEECGRARVETSTDRGRTWKIGFNDKLELPKLTVQTSQKV